MGEGKLKKASEHEVAAEIRKAIGVGPDEDVSVMTPQFERTPDMPAVGAPPATRQEWEDLRTMSVDALREMGLGVWNEPDLEGKVLMLFPGEWYSSIPDGFLIEDICSPVEASKCSCHIRSQPEYFKSGVTDNDIRFGCLAFGVRVKA